MSFIADKIRISQFRDEPAKVEEKKRTVGLVEIGFKAGDFVEFDKSILETLRGKIDMSGIRPSGPRLGNAVVPKTTRVEVDGIDLGYWHKKLGY